MKSHSLGAMLLANAARASGLALACALMSGDMVRAPGLSCGHTAVSAVTISRLAVVALFSDAVSISASSEEIVKVTDVACGRVVAARGQSCASR